MHHLADRHETPFRSLSGLAGKLAALAVGTRVQRRPSQEAAIVPSGPGPTAMHEAGEVQETLLNQPLGPLSFGVGTAAQLLPFHDSASGRPKPLSGCST